MHISDIKSYSNENRSNEARLVKPVSDSLPNTNPSYLDRSSPVTLHSLKRPIAGSALVDSVDSAMSPLSSVASVGEDNRERTGLSTFDRTGQSGVSGASSSGLSFTAGLVSSHGLMRTSEESRQGLSSSALAQSRAVSTSWPSQAVRGGAGVSSESSGEEDAAGVVVKGERLDRSQVRMSTNTSISSESDTSLLLERASEREAHYRSSQGAGVGTRGYVVGEGAALGDTSSSSELSVELGLLKSGVGLSGDCL